MKNKKGFTLIELLAVIVILAVIALIATPLIMGTIEKAKVNAYKDTIYGILKAGENYVAEILLENENTYTGETLDLSTENKLNYKGTKPKEGTMEFTKTGDTALYVKNGHYCYIKRKHSNEIEVIKNAKECSIRVARNLVKNGYLEYGDNTNFKSMEYKDGRLVATANTEKSYVTDEMIPFDSNKKYNISATLKSSTTSSKYQVGIQEFDRDKKIIIYAYYNNYFGNTLTELKQDLKKGDTKIYVNNLSNFSQIADDSQAYGIIFWNYKDSTGYQYQPLTYSRNSYQNIYTIDGLDKTNHVITLKAPWEKGTIPAGTKLSQSKNGNYYNYCLTSIQSIPTVDTKYQYTMTGIASAAGEFKFHHGGHYMKPLIILNRLNVTETTATLKEFVIEEE